MPSEAYQQFLDSMIMNFDKWKDGIGYDLEALERLGPAELALVEELLIKNLEQAGNWRDVEALVALGTASSLTAVDKARFHNKARVRNYALRYILDTRNSEDLTEKETTELEGQVIQAVAQGYFEMAKSMPTMRVKKVLLDSTQKTDYEFRGSAAALLLYLCGQAPEPYDWSQRPFFLRFSNDDPEALQSAWDELRKRTGF